MATEIAAAYVSLVPSGRGFSRHLTRELSGLNVVAGRVGSDVSTSLHSRITSGFSRTVSDLGRMATRGGLAIGAGLGLAGGWGIKVAADFEQTRIAFAGILGDVDRANYVLGDLRAFAAKTPFEFPGLADSAKQLLAVGFTASDIIPTMTTLGNVAATLGVGEAEIAGTVRALGQMKGKGKASAEELQQISEQLPGFSAISVIAKDMGITVSEAFDLLAKGKIPATDAIESILNGMEKFPGAAGAMERQSKTLNGVISTFKDTLSTTAIDFITPYLPQLSSAVSSFGGFISTTLVPGLSTFVGWLGDIKDRFGPGVVSFFTDHLIPTVKGLASDGLEAIKSWWDRNGDNIIGFFVSFGVIAGGILGALGDWIWKTVLPALDGFRDWFVNNEFAVKTVLAVIATGFLLWAINAALAAAATILANLPLIILVGIIALLVAGLWYAWENWDWFRTGVVKATIALIVIGGIIGGIIRFIWDLVEAINEAIRKFERLADVASLGFSDYLPGGNGGITRGYDWGGIKQKKSKSSWLPEFGDGGVMPGPRGQHSLALIAGGETVIPTHKADPPWAAGVGGRGPLIGGDLVVQQMPGEDAGQATMRGLRKVSMVSA